MSSTLLSVSIALLGGLLMTRAFKPLKLPAVTAYLIAGVLIGPYFIGRLGIEGFGFATGEAVHNLALIADVALGFIAFSIGSEFRLEDLKKTSSYTFTARTVFPSITLPCHLSMFHSVPPERHGTLNNDYSVPVRPVSGLFEQVKFAGKSSAMFYGWHPLRDICRSGSLTAAEYLNAYAMEHTDGI